MGFCASVANIKNGMDADQRWVSPLVIVFPINPFLTVPLPHVLLKGKYYYEATVTDEGLCRMGWSTRNGVRELGEHFVVYVCVYVCVIFILFFPYQVKINLALGMGAQQRSLQLASLMTMERSALSLLSPGVGSVGVGSVGVGSVGVGSKWGCSQSGSVVRVVAIQM